MPKRKTRNTIYWITYEVNTVNQIGPVYVILQNKTFYQKIIKKTVPWKLVSDPFMFYKN